jgi:hypothetical protein
VTHNLYDYGAAVLRSDLNLDAELIGSVGLLRVYSNQADVQRWVAHTIVSA